MKIRTSVLAAGLSLLSTSPLRGEEPAAGHQISEWLEAYDAAFNSRDVERLSAFYHPQVTIFEGGTTNDGWADYRDNHLGPELKEMEAVEFSHSSVSAHAIGSDDRAAYVTAEYRLKARIGGKDVDALGLETLVVVKDGAGSWKIRHSHTSSRRRPPPPTGSSPKP